jgi:IMP cyclohydrolase
LPYKQDILKGALEVFGPEPDELHTPRIAADIKTGVNGIETRVGMVSTEGIEAIFNEQKGKSTGVFRQTTTYYGDNADKPHAPPLEFCIGEGYFKGETAQELAAEIYGMIDSNLIVCSAAAVWTGSHWQLAVKNMHEAKS